jgi:hypothetical protein
VSVSAPGHPVFEEVPYQVAPAMALARPVFEARRAPNPMTREGAEDPESEVHPEPAAVPSSPAALLGSIPVAVPAKPLVAVAKASHPASFASLKRRQSACPRPDYEFGLPKDVVALCPVSEQNLDSHPLLAKFLECQVVSS